MDYLIEPSFLVVNRILVSSFEDEAQRTSYKWKYLPTVEEKCYDWWTKPFWSSSKKLFITYDNIQKIATGQRDDYTTLC